MYYKFEKSVIKRVSMSILNKIGTDTLTLHFQKDLLDVERILSANPAYDADLNFSKVIYTISLKKGCL